VTVFLVLDSVAEIIHPFTFVRFHGRPTSRIAQETLRTVAHIFKSSIVGRLERPNGILASWSHALTVKIKLLFLGGFDSIDVGRFTYEHGHKEFLIIDNVTIIVEEYRRRDTIQ
jgi:hypothetical protein